jgi:replicative DNA helicase
MKEKDTKIKEIKKKTDSNNYPQHNERFNQETTKMFSGISEREVIGCILQDDSIIPKILKFIPTSQVFYHNDHEIIWKSIYHLYKTNKKIDLPTVCNHLAAKGYKMTFYLTGIHIVSTANVSSHAKTIYDLYIRRKLFDSILKFEKRLRNESTYKDISTDISYLSKISEKFTGVVSVDDKNIASLTDDVEQQIYKKTNLVQTGLAKIDKAIVGMTKGEISIIAGRPGNGKSTLALNIVKNMVLDGKKVMLISREMPSVEIVKKLIAMHTNVKNKEMRGNAHLHKEEIQKGLDFIRKHYKSLYLFDNLRTLDDALNEAKKIQPDIIIDDHIGFIEFPHYDKQDVRHRIAEITRRYKWLAKDIDCAVLLVSQLNRNIEHRVDKIPRLSDLAESGNLEQDAEIVVFCYYPYVYEYDNSEHGEYGTQIIVAKNRYGTTCKFDMGYDGDSAMILDSPAEAKAHREDRVLTSTELAEELF